MACLQRSLLSFTLLFHSISTLVFSSASSFFQEALRTPWGVLFGGGFSNLWETFQEFAFPQIVGCLSSQCSCSSFHWHEIQNAAKLDFFFDLMYQAYLCCRLTQKISVTLAALPFQSASLSFDGCTMPTWCFNNISWRFAEMKHAWSYRPRPRMKHEWSGLIPRPSPHWMGRGFTNTKNMGNIVHVFYVYYIIHWKNYSHVVVPASLVDYNYYTMVL